MKTFLNRLILAVLVTLEITSSLSAENPIKIKMESSLNSPGEYHCVQLSVLDFKDVAAMQFSVQFNPEMLKLESISNGSLPGLEEGESINMAESEEGIIRVVWFDVTAQGQSLANGQDLFEMCFQVKDDAVKGSCSEIQLANSPTIIEFVNINGQLVEFEQDPGVVCISSDIVISEIMYNPPESGSDSLEYVEIYNNTGETIDLSGWSFTQGFDFTFGDQTLEAGAYLAIALNADAIKNNFGVDVLQWENGALSNGGEDIELSDASGNVVAYVDYDSSDPWTTAPNGGGPSLEYCIGSMENNNADNWKASTNGTGIMINGEELKGTPGAANSVVCAPQADATVILSGLDFTPADLSIFVGETVLWRNEGGVHNVNGSIETYPNNPEGFFSGDPMPDPFEFSHTFTKEGFYNYQCDPHVGAGMVGTITVVADVPELVITEIFYNDPSSDDQDSLEFLEIYNAGENAVNLDGIILSTKEIIDTLPPEELAAGSFLILHKTDNSILDSADALKIKWKSGSLDNLQDNITLKSQDGMVLDTVSYANTAPWPEASDDLGASLSLCAVSEDNLGPDFWQLSSSSTTFTIDEVPLKINPGEFNACIWEIPIARTIDNNGALVYEGVEAIIDGFVLGINTRPGGLEFTIINENNVGINVFKADSELGYTVREGEEIRVRGTLGQFNGLATIYLGDQDIEILNDGIFMIDPVPVTELGEETESSLIAIENLELLDPSQWLGDGSSFNVDITNGTNTFVMRIDNDMELSNMPYPTGTFDIVGIGGQFDGSSPFFSGYQIMPRYMEDFDPYSPFEVSFPFRSIAEMTGTDANGVADSINMNCTLQGIVYGVNLRPTGLQFTIIDASNNGIGVFNNTGDLGYTVNEGDEVRIQGSISQFNGLTQINPVSVELLSSGNVLFEPTEVDELNELTESQLIILENVQILDPSQWEGDGGSFNVDILLENGEQTAIRIDGDVDLSNVALPGELLSVVGIGGQFDSSSPFNEGYQILPRYLEDVMVVSSSNELILEKERIHIYPNPSSSYLQFQSETKINRIILYNLLGQRIKEVNQNNSIIDVRDLENGNYYLQFITDEGIIMKEIQIAR